MQRTCSILAGVALAFVACRCDRDTGEGGPIWPDGSSLLATHDGPATVRLQWTAAEHPEGIAEYQILLDDATLREVAGDVLEVRLRRLPHSTPLLFRVEARDEEGRWSTGGPTAEIVLPDETPPRWPDGSTLTAVSDGSDGVLLSWSQAEHDVGVVGYRVYQDGARVGETEPDVRTHALTGIEVGAVHRFRVQAGSIAGYWSEDGPSTIHIREAPARELAVPPLDPSVATNIFDATRFLYTGLDPIQTGLDPDTIDPRRVAVLRGRVTDPAGSPLRNVEVTVHGRPELGQTVTRSDGEFDLVVNGGGVTVLHYHRPGFLPVQRRVRAPIQDWTWAPDVTLLPLDDRPTRIDLSREVTQVARGSLVSDDDGVRQATVIVPGGVTGATLTLPDGSVVHRSAVTVRATEYTVGPNGQRAMPAGLPANVAYTYAVELSVDEAVEVGAVRVEFDQAVISYVENFLGFPVGSPVPMGWYDHEAAAWVPMPDGVVVEVLEGQGDLADLDLDGDGQPNGLEELAALGVTEGERLRLAETYEPGTTLWRVPVTHFTPFDKNWPVDFPEDALPPWLRLLMEISAGCKRSGSILDAHRQVATLYEEIPGTPYGLVYQSDRTPGRREGCGLDFIATADEIPSTLESVEVDIQIAGQRHQTSLSAEPNVRHQWRWDGRDVYGREVQGEQAVTLRIGYTYPFVYAEPDTAGQSFGQAGFSAITGDLARETLTVWQEWRTTVGVWDARGHGLGGWSVDVHHAYNPQGRALHLGHGLRSREAEAIGPLFEPIAGESGACRSWLTDDYPACGDGGPAHSARFAWIERIAMGPEGTLYVLENYSVGDILRIRRIDPDGTITTVAGSPEGLRLTDDGVAAIDARLDDANAIAVGPDGSVYVGEQSRIRRIGPDGIIRTVAGTGEACNYLEGYDPFDPDWQPDSCGAGGPATEASFAMGVLDVAVDSEGTLYLADTNRILKVDPSGTLQHVAGVLPIEQGREGDGIPARDATLGMVQRLAVGPNDDLYLLGMSAVHRIDAGGILHRVAGSPDVSCDHPDFPDCGNGGPATSARLHVPRALAVGPDGALFIGELARTRRVSPDGIINDFAGVVDGRPEPRGAAAEVTFTARDVVVGQNHVVYLALDDGITLAHVASAMPGFDGTAFAIADETGTEVYLFSPDGRHLATLDATTGAERLSFTYDGSGRLAAIVDAYGRTTEIERDAEGGLTAIVAPGGQRLGLETDGAGYLVAVEDANGGRRNFEYDERGLLTRQVDRRDGEKRYLYDDNGRLTLVVDETGAEQSFTRTDFEGLFPAHTVVHRDPVGRETSYTVLHDVGGVTVTTETSPSGARTHVAKGPGTRSTLELPDGTTVVVDHGADPQWGMRAPVPVHMRLITPSGRTFVMDIETTADLDDARDPLSLNSRTQSITVDGVVTERHYDAASRTVTITSPEGRTRRVVLDASGRMASAASDGWVEDIFAVHDAVGRLTHVEHGERHWSYTHDGSDRVATITDALGRVFGISYGPDDRPNEVALRGGEVVSFDHDADGNRVAVVLPSGVAHTAQWSATGRLAERTIDGGTTTHWTYGPDGSVTNEVRPSGRTASYGYDAFGRLQSVIYPDSTLQLTYAPGTDDVSGVSREGEVDLVVERDGPLIDAVQWSGALEARVSFEYDASFRPTHRRLEVAGQVFESDLTYDTDGHLIGLGPFSLERLGPGGAVSVITDGVATWTFQYDEHGDLESRSLVVAGAEAFAFEVERDTGGQVVGRTDRVSGTETTHAFEYDQDRQLLRALRESVEVEAYAYDVNQNRISRRLGAGTEETASFDVQDRITVHGAVDHVVDADGFLAERGADTFEYGFRGELLEATVEGVTVSYVYDGFGRRVSRHENGDITRYVYGDGSRPFQPTAVVLPDGSVVRLYHDELGSLLALERAGTRHYVGADLVGTPRMVVDGEGSVVAAWDYDAFGRLLVSDGDLGYPLPVGFGGGLADQRTGLIRMGLRDYDPESGRFTARDPLGFDARMVNLYAYAGNDPVGLTDPLGLWAVNAGAQLYGGLGGGGSVHVGPAGGRMCLSAGVGAGAKVGVSLTNGLPSEGVRAQIAAKADVVFLSAESKISIDHCGNFKAEAPVSIEVPNVVRAGYDPLRHYEGSHPFDVEFGRDYKPDMSRNPEVRDPYKGKAFGVGAQVAGTVRHCVSIW